MPWHRSTALLLLFVSGVIVQNAVCFALPYAAVSWQQQHASPMVTVKSRCCSVKLLSSIIIKWFVFLFLHCAGKSDCTHQVLYLGKGSWADGQFMLNCLTTCLRHSSCSGLAQLYFLWPLLTHTLLFSLLKTHCTLGKVCFSCRKGSYLHMSHSFLDVTGSHLRCNLSTCTLIGNRCSALLSGTGF